MNNKSSKNINSYQIIYNSNIDIIYLIETLLNDNKISKTDLAKKLNMSRQNLQSLLSKKNLNNDDIKRILDVLDYELIIQFKPKNDFIYTPASVKKTVSLNDMIERKENNIQDLSKLKDYIDRTIEEAIDKKISEYDDSEFTKMMNKLIEDFEDDDNN